MHYSLECSTGDLIDCVMSAIVDDIENSISVFQNIDRDSVFQYALTDGKGTLWINNYEANAYGTDNQHSDIIHTLYAIGASPKFIW
jgi:hypothetical protein